MEALYFSEDNRYQEILCQRKQIKTGDMKFFPYVIARDCGKSNDIKMLIILRISLRQVKRYKNVNNLKNFFTTKFEQFF